MKVKAVVILEEALKLIISGEQKFVCSAIQDVETTMRWELRQEITSNALAIFYTFKPKEVRKDVQMYSEWWPKGDERRIEALTKAIALAKKQNN